MFQAVEEPNVSTQRLIGYLALSVFVTCCGCGTMANIDGRRVPALSETGQEVARPFGGVRRDVEWIKAGTAPGNLKYVADLPLSLVGDIVTLPTTVIGVQSDSLLTGTEPVGSLATERKGVVPDPTATMPPSLQPSAN
jgi:hypothetical protein